MKPATRSPLTWITSLALVFSLCCGIMVTDNAHAASSRSDGGEGIQHQKLADDLRDRARGAAPDETLKVIVQLNGAISGELNGLLQSNGIKIKHFCLS